MTFWFDSKKNSNMNKSDLVRDASPLPHKSNGLSDASNFTKNERQYLGNKSSIEIHGNKAKFQTPNTAQDVRKKPGTSDYSVGRDNYENEGINIRKPKTPLRNKTPQNQFQKNLNDHTQFKPSISPVTSSAQHDSNYYQISSNENNGDFHNFNDQFHAGCANEERHHMLPDEQYQELLESLDYPYKEHQTQQYTPNDHGNEQFTHRPRARPNLQSVSGKFQQKAFKKVKQNQTHDLTMAIKKPPKTFAADWTCTACGNINFARRISCNICDMPKPYLEILKTPISQLGPQGLFKDTDWQCFNCRNVNFQKRSFCNVCNEPKPEEYLEREQEMKNKTKQKKKNKSSNNLQPARANTLKRGSNGNLKNNAKISKSQSMRGLNQSNAMPQKKMNNKEKSANAAAFKEKPVQRARSRSFVKK